MNLKEYFRSQDGIGILSTADADGRADAALVRVEIEEAVHVVGFQRASTWRPDP